MTLRPRGRTALLCALAFAAGCSGRGSDAGGAGATTAPEATAAAAPAATATATPFDPAKPLSANAKCLGSLAEGSELMALVAKDTRKPGPVTGCVSTGTWAIERWNDGTDPVSSLFAYKDGGHWQHIAHGPKFIAVKDMMAVSQIDAPTAQRLEKMERTLK